MCLLDDEVEAVPGTMRATGDWVQVKDSCLYFLGRQDRLIKRQGQRVHLDTLQQVSILCFLEMAQWTPEERPWCVMKSAILDLPFKIHC